MSDQQHFDSQYITSSEICQTLGVSRAAVVRARQRGDLPPAVQVNGTQIFIWPRTRMRRPLEEWRRKLAERRGE